MTPRRRRALPPPRARALAALALAVGIAGCAGPAGAPRDAALRLVTGATVSLRIEREPSVRRSASGVAVAVDRARGRTWIVTSRHVFEQRDGGARVLVSAPGTTKTLVAQVVGMSPDVDLAVLEVGT